jgi:hypothetical protein
MMLLIVVFTLLRPVEFGALRGKFDVLDLLRGSASSVKSKLRNIKSERSGWINPCRSIEREGIACPWCMRIVAKWSVVSGL